MKKRDCYYGDDLFYLLADDFRLLAECLYHTADILHLLADEYYGIAEYV